MRKAMILSLWCVTAILIAGCATGDSLDPSPIGTAGGGGNGQGGNGQGGNGSGGDGTGNGGNGGSGGNAPTGRDAIPQNGIGFFQMPACPTGWEPFKAASGRAILPTVGTMAGGATVGTPLGSGEERKHTHSVQAAFNLIDISYVGVAGGGNSGVAKAGAASFTTTSDPASTGLPYVQLLACKKVAPPEAAAKPLPAGMQLFFNMATCPGGWKQTAATQGRFIVGLPKGAPADVAFGGEPISSAMPRLHTHKADVSVTTTAHGIALAAGCCGSGYAKNGTYTNSQDTGNGDASMPWIELLHCEKL